MEYAEFVEVGEVELVADDNLVGLVAECHCGGLVDFLYLGKFRCPCTFGCDDTVVEEVALVRSGHVVARNVVWESVGGDSGVKFFGVEPDAGNEHVVGYDGRVVDSLVYPVPDAASDARGAAFDDVPIFLQVADGVSHGVGIFAHEVGACGAV